MEQRLFQALVDDAAAICGAVAAELRLRPGVLEVKEPDPLDSTPPWPVRDGGLVPAAVGGTLAQRRANREPLARKFAELDRRGLLPPPAQRAVKLAQLDPAALEVLEPGVTLAPRELWSADVPLWVEGVHAGALRLLLSSAPGRPMLRTLRGVGHEAGQQLEQERARRRAHALLAQVREARAVVASAATRLRRQVDPQQVMQVLSDELRQLGFESGVALVRDDERLSLVYLSHRPATIARGLRLLGLRRFADLEALSVDPSRSPLLSSVLGASDPVVEVRSDALLRALFGRRATKAARARLTVSFRLGDSVLAAPLRGGGDQAMGILFAFARARRPPDLGALADFALHASWALERHSLRERSFRAAANAEREVAERTADLRAEVERLLEVDKRKDNFLANVSHELRSPLVTVLGYTEMLLDERLGPLSDRQRQCLQVARSSGRRLKTFIEELMDFSRFELTRAAPRLARVDLAPLVAHAVEGLTPRLLERRLSLRQRVPGGLAVRGDKEQLHQVLVNLLANAERHCRDGGRIEVRAEDRGSHLALSVRDNGSGIAPEHLARIFERLYQAGDAAGRSREGMGLGLHIVKSLVEAHGGTVEVESKLGEGSTFTFAIPVWS